MFAARVLSDPTDWPSRANHAIALYRAGRWTQAAEAFRKLIDEVGPAHLHAIPMMFSIGYCLLQLDDPMGVARVHDSLPQLLQRAAPLLRGLTREHGLCMGATRGRGRGEDVAASPGTARPPGHGRHDAKAHAPPLEPKAGHRDEPSVPRPIGQAPACPPLLVASRG